MKNSIVKLIYVVFDLDFKPMLHFLLNLLSLLCLFLRIKNDSRQNFMNVVLNKNERKKPTEARINYLIEFCLPKKYKYKSNLDTSH